jgi:3',5'-cyclic AMP phosphodiesterase CpdA
LQLSATLRDAVPYKIRVATYLVEPLLIEIRNDERVRLLHISDLHLVEDLTDPRRGGSPTLGVAKHNFETAKLLGRAIDSLRPRFDLVVATGDLTTDGKRGSFDTVLQYIQSGPISGENKMRIAAFGLNAGKDRRLLIPGNHDRYEGRLVPGQRLSGLFEEVLGKHAEQYPYLVGFRPPGQPETSLTLLLFGFDSNLPAGAKGVGLEDVKNRLARGRINSEEVTRMVNLARAAAENNVVKDLNGRELKFDPKNTVRVALLHHHPVARWETEETEMRTSEEGAMRWLTHPIASLKSAMKAVDEEGMSLEGANDFLSGCFLTGIQLILFGHRHYPFRRAVVTAEKAVGSIFGETDSLRAFCCPTTLQFSKFGNGFYLFDFLERDTVDIGFYVSRIGADNVARPFSRVADQSGKFKLSQISDEERRTSYNVHVVRGLPPRA